MKTGWNNERWITRIQRCTHLFHYLCCAWPSLLLHPRRATFLKRLRSSQRQHQHCSPGHPNLHAEVIAVTNITYGSVQVHWAHGNYRHRGGTGLRMRTVPAVTSSTLLDTLSQLYIFPSNATFATLHIKLIYYNAFIAARLVTQKGNTKYALLYFVKCSYAK